MNVYNSRFAVACMIVIFPLLLCAIAVNGCDNGNTNDPGSGNGQTATSKIARWDGNAWHALGQGVSNRFTVDAGSPAVNDIIVNGNLIYAGGSFDAANSTRVNSLATWTNNDWQGYGSIEVPGVLRDFGPSIQFPGEVHAMVVSTAVGSGSTLYVGGSFSTVVNYVASGGLNANNIAMFYLQLGTWDLLGSGVNGSVKALAVNDFGLFVGGDFQSAGGMPNTNLIARWSISASAWASIGGGIVGSEVNALTVDPQNPNTVYVGGNFSSAGGLSTLNIAKWAGNQWTSMGSGLNGTVYDIAVLGNDVYAAGQFFTQDYLSFYILAKWDGSSWTLLGDRVTPAGQQSLYDIKGLSLEVRGNELFLGGHFNTIDGVTVNHIARWNGSSWSPLTGGVKNIGTELLSGVRSIVALGNDIYAGGTFNAAGP